MKALILIIVTVVLTTLGINWYNSFTGTRAKSDDRSDDRVKGIEKSKIAIENAKLDNTIKTQAKTIKDSNSRIRAKDTTIALYASKTNKQTVIIKKLERALINSQESYAKLRARKSTKTRYKKKTKRKVTTSRKTKSVKSSRQKRYETHLKSLKSKKSASSKKISALKKQAKKAKLIIGREKRKEELKKIKSKYNREMNIYKTTVRNIEKLMP